MVPTPDRPDGPYGRASESSDDPPDTVFGPVRRPGDRDPVTHVRWVDKCGQAYVLVNSIYLCMLTIGHADMHEWHNDTASLRWPQRQWLCGALIDSDTVARRTDYMCKLEKGHEGRHRWWNSAGTVVLEKLLEGERP